MLLLKLTVQLRFSILSLKYSRKTKCSFACSPQLLEEARELHKFFYEAKEVLAMIQEKENLLTDDLGRDLNSLHQLQVVHQGFEADLAPLGNQVGHVFKISRPFGGSYRGYTTFPAFLQPQIGCDEVPRLKSIFPPVWLQISRLQ